MLEHLTPEQSEALLTALLLVVTALFAVLTTLAVTLGRKVVKHLSALSGVQVSAEQQAKVDQAITAGVAYAEEQARKLARELITEGPRTSEEKLEVAKTAARSIAPAALADVSEQQLGILTEAKVRELRDSARPEAVPGLLTTALDKAELAAIDDARASLVPKLPPLPVFSTLGPDTNKTPLPPRRR